MSFALLQFNPSSVVLMDSEGRIRSLNHNAERLLSTTEAEAVGKVYTDVFGESLSARVFALMLKGTRADVRLVEATLPGGRRAKLRATAGPIRDEGGAGGRHRARLRHRRPYRRRDGRKPRERPVPKFHRHRRYGERRRAFTSTGEGW